MIEDYYTRKLVAKTISVMEAVEGMPIGVGDIASICKLSTTEASNVVTRCIRSKYISRSSKKIGNKYVYALTAYGHVVAARGHTFEVRRPQIKDMQPLAPIFKILVPRVGEIYC